MQKWIIFLKDYLIGLKAQQQKFSRPFSEIVSSKNAHGTMDYCLMNSKNNELHLNVIFGSIELKWKI